MKLISLGNACKVRESIDRFIGGSQETNIFDWVISDFSSVVTIFQAISNNNEKTLFDPNLFVNEGSHPNNITHLCISHKFINFKSLHDVENNQETFDYNFQDFIKKYLRRSERLRSIIKDSTEAINFIYFVCLEENIPTKEQMYYFIICIQKMNRNLNFKIHILIPPEFSHFKKKISESYITNHVNYFYMKEKANIDPVLEQRQNLNCHQSNKAETG